MNRPAKTIPEKMIKVDHVGENGAVNIYRAQALVAGLLIPDLKGRLLDFQSHEEQHREIFRSYLSANGIRRCVSYHAGGVGGFILGLVTGLMGRNAIFATTYAVENVVLDHLQHQLDYLREADSDAYKAVNSIYRDEKEHHDTAHDQLDKTSAIAKTLISVVRFCTNSVIRFGMR